MRHYAFLIILLTVTLTSADDLIFHSPFVSGEGKSEIGSKWEIGHGKWIVKDGELTGKQVAKDGHADASKSFSFKNDKWYKGSLIVNGKNYSLTIGDNEVLKGSNELITRKKNLLLFNMGGESASIRNVKIYK